MEKIIGDIEEMKRQQQANQNEFQLLRTEVIAKIDQLNIDELKRQQQSNQNEFRAFRTEVIAKINQWNIDLQSSRDEIHSMNNTIRRMQGETKKIKAVFERSCQISKCGRRNEFLIRMYRSGHQRH